MDEEQEIIVQELIERVRGLMSRYSELKEHYDLLNHENDDLRHQIEEQNIKIDKLISKYNFGKIKKPWKNLRRIEPDLDTHTFPVRGKGKSGTSYSKS